MHFVACTLRLDRRINKVTTSNNATQTETNHTTHPKENIMNNFSNVVTFTKDNVAAALVLATVAIAIVASSFHGTAAVATEPTPVVKMDTIVITAKRIEVVKLDTIVVTASRINNVA
jgi:hypothetical protein